MSVRQVQLSSEPDPILDSVAAAFGGDAGLAISELLLAHESIESFLDELEGSNAGELTRQRDRSTREFQEGLTVSWNQVKHNNQLVTDSSPTQLNRIFESQQCGLDDCGPMPYIR
jgi:hypothetical protein